MSADYRTLHHLHQAASAHFAYTPDTEAFGEQEHWISPIEIASQIKACGMVCGDCDDFASLVVMVARHQGLPARFVLCETEAGERHLVAEVEGWILDNRQPDVMRRDDLDYTWLAVSGYRAGEAWHAIKTTEGGNQNA